MRLYNFQRHTRQNLKAQWLKKTGLNDFKNAEVNCFIFILNLEIVTDKHPAIHLDMHLLQLFP